MSSFHNKTDEQIKKFLNEQNFLCVRKLPDGEWIGILKLAYTFSVCMGIEDITPFKYRWCFQNPEHAKEFYDNAVEYDEIPNAELQKSLKGHRHQSAPLIILYDEHGFPKWH